MALATISASRRSPPIPSLDDDNHTWQGDRIEQAHRIWEWWHAKDPKLDLFFTAAHLVVITPISSASVEWVFGQVKVIVEAIGESVLGKIS